MPVQPAYIQAPTQHQMFHAQPVAAQMPNMTMTPPASTITMAPPVGARVSMRATKGQTNRYDDFVQQITLKPGTYASDGNNLYMMEDIGNKSNMLNMLKAIPTWQQKIGQNWSPDTAYVQQLSCDSHHQTPWIPTYWNTDMSGQQCNMMTSNMMNGNMMSNNMMNGNMMTSNMMTNNSGYLTNEGYSCYQDYST
jgi:hypothetical protein